MNDGLAILYFCESKRRRIKREGFSVVRFYLLFDTVFLKYHGY